MVTYVCKTCGAASSDVTRGGMHCEACRTDANRAKVRKWQDANPDTAQTATKAWREANIERARESCRRTATAHHARVGYDTVTRQRASDKRRATKLAAFVHDIDRAFVFEYYAGVCHICQTPADPTDWHLDHVIPLARGGEHSYDNVNVSHPACNLRKGTKLMTEV